MSDALAGAVVTALFVPGSAGHRFAKAQGAGADTVILDLEDAVKAEDRPSARAAIGQFLRDTTSRERLWVRINSANSADHESDLATLRSLKADAALPAAVVLPKAERTADVDRLRAVVGSDVEVVALVESASGYAAARELACAVAPGGRLAFGALDFGVDVGSESPAVFDIVATELIIASRLADVAGPLASPSPDIRDMTAVRGSAERSARLGFGGMLCIHPSQVPIVVEAFLPTEEDTIWARAVLAAGDGASQVGGQMVDAPVVARARRILERSRTVTV